MQTSTGEHKIGARSLQLNLTKSEHAKGIIYHVNLLEYLVNKQQNIAWKLEKQVKLNGTLIGKLLMYQKENE